MCEIQITDFLLCHYGSERDKWLHHVIAYNIMWLHHHKVSRNAGESHACAAIVTGQLYTLSLEYTAMGQSSS